MQENLLRFQKDKKLCFFDLETESLCLNARYNRPWQISWINVVGESITEQNDHFPFYQDLNISADAARITRFNYADYKKKSEPLFPVLEKIYEDMTNADYIVGHNILGFDVCLMAGMMQMIGKGYYHFLNKVIDTNSIARGKKMEIPFKAGENLLEYQFKINSKVVKTIKSKLSVLADEYKIPYDKEKLHDGLYDLWLNIQVFNKLKWEVEI